MNLLEAVIGILILWLILVLWVNFIVVSQVRNMNLEVRIKTDAQKISLYNFAEELIDTDMYLWVLNTWYVHLSGNDFAISSNYLSWNSNYFECKNITWTIIKIKKPYIARNCRIKFGNDWIENYKLK